jgi:hypothetical protein
MPHLVLPTVSVNEKSLSVTCTTALFATNTASLIHTCDILTKLGLNFSQNDRRMDQK